jgi:hypothetical protein
MHGVIGREKLQHKREHKKVTDGVSWFEYFLINSENQFRKWT